MVFSDGTLRNCHQSCSRCFRRVVKKVGSINSASAHTAAIMVENGISEEIFPSSELHTMMSNLSGEAAEVCLPCCYLIRC